MKHKTWFRLVLKAIGILVLTFSTPTLLWILGSSLINQLLTASPSTGGMRPSFDGWEYTLPQLLHYGFQTAIGLYLLFGGKWIVNKCIPSNRPYCPECGYDLSKATGVICPECGVALPTTPSP